MKACDPYPPEFYKRFYEQYHLQAPAKRKAAQKKFLHKYFSCLTDWLLIALVGIEYALLLGMSLGVGAVISWRLLQG